MINQHKIYKYADLFLFIIYALLTIVVCTINNIEINEFGIVPINYLSKYFLSNLPLIITYPIFHFTNVYFYESGVYHKYLRRWKK